MGAPTSSSAPLQTSRPLSSFVARAWAASLAGSPLLEQLAYREFQTRNQICHHGLTLPPICDRFITFLLEAKNLHAVIGKVDDPVLAHPASRIQVALHEKIALRVR